MRILAPCENRAVLCQLAAIDFPADKPTITVVVGDWLGGKVDAFLLRIIIEEVHSLTHPNPCRRPAGTISIARAT